MICNGLASLWRKLLNSSNRGTSLRRIRNAGVVGSNPIVGTITFDDLQYKFGSGVGQCIIQASTLKLLCRLR